MHKLFIGALCLLSACITVNKPQTPPESQPPSPSEAIDEEEEREWTGPGWYWGIYIGDEDDYWNHYNHRHGDEYDHHGGDGGGHHGGEGHGGGGHR